MRLWPTTPCWGRVPAIAVVLVCALVVPGSAQPRSKKSDKSEQQSGQPAKIDPKAEAKSEPPDKGDKPGKKPAVKNFDFSGLDLNGRMRTPQLLYFLERANEELERASLEKRSFIPHLVRTVEEETL
jgi:hypothetical protein